MVKGYKTGCVCQYTWMGTSTRVVGILLDFPPFGPNTSGKRPKQFAFWDSTILHFAVWSCYRIHHWANRATFFGCLLVPGKLCLRLSNCEISAFYLYHSIAHGIISLLLEPKGGQAIITMTHLKKVISHFYQHFSFFLIFDLCW